jgi:glycerophosphoryl diester phosphodiesterase
MMFRLALLATLLVPLPALAAPGPEYPLVIAHRGASGYRPEHSASAYRLAIQQGADYVEPDLCMTRDGVLVARHENEIGRTTDVADHPEFASRRTTRTIDGETFTGWFVEDFTFAELKTLTTRERRPELRRESAGLDHQERVLSLQEIIDIAREGGQQRGRPVGLYIELKNPDYHRSIGLPMEQALVDILQRNGLNRRDAPVFVESFWPSALVNLRKLSPVRLTFLVNSEPPPESILKANHIDRWSDVYSAEGLRKIATFADAVGPETRIVLPRGPDGRTGAPTDFVANAHKVGLEVHLWPFPPKMPICRSISGVATPRTRIMPAWPATRRVWRERSSPPGSTVPSPTIPIWWSPPRPRASYITGPESIGPGSAPWRGRPAPSAVPARETAQAADRTSRHSLGACRREGDKWATAANAIVESLGRRAGAFTALALTARAKARVYMPSTHDR